MERQFAILVIIDIVESTKFIETVGDVKAAQAMRLYDRIFRGLLIKWSGVEIDKTDGALLIFETMREALQYVTEYHKLVEHHLGLKSRVGIHAGHVMMSTNHAHFVSRGAKPVEVEGVQKHIAARIMSLAGPGQTLLSKRAGEYASSVRAGLMIRDIGRWRLKGVRDPIQIYVVSWDQSRMKPPKETSKVKLIKPPKLTPEERRRRFFWRWVAPYLMLLIGREHLMILALFEQAGLIPYLYLDAMSRGVSAIVSFIHGLFYF